MLNLVLKYDCRTVMMSGSSNMLIGPFLNNDIISKCVLVSKGVISSMLFRTHFKLHTQPICLSSQQLEIHKQKPARYDF